LWFILGKAFKEQNQLDEAIVAFRSLKNLYEEMEQPELVKRCEAVLKSLLT
jgi:hypothetical protein